MALPSLHIAIAQINSTVGDVAGNVRKILHAHEKASVQGAQLVVFPELAITGYPPEDLVLSPAFRAQATQALLSLARQTQGKAAMIVGGVWEGNPHPNLLPGREKGQEASPSPFQGEGRGEGIYNVAALLDEGRLIHVQPKTHLPNYGVFDERRLFDAGSPEVMEWRGHTLGVLVCEDTWHSDQAETLKNQGAGLLISINASPFEAGKADLRRKIVSHAVQKTQLPLVYVNCVGGQDDIVFDGGSFVMDAAGEVVVQMAEFEEQSLVGEMAGEWWIVDGNEKHRFTSHQPLSTNHRLWQAMRLGLADYVEKNGFPGVILGLSGGIDSALTAACAVDALGASRVKGVLMPSPYTSKESVEDALELAKSLGIETFAVPITPGMQTMEEVLSPVFKDAAWMENVAVGG